MPATDLADAAQVDSAEQLGSPNLEVDQLLTRVGYIGKKRYVRAQVQGVATTDIDGAHGLALLLNAIHQPTAEQPAS